MPNSNKNVILFPNFRERLENESLQALQQKKYSEALSKLNKLLSYQINSHEIIIGKLICLMELGQYKEAQDLCEDLLTNRDEHYYHYVHIYLTILFQTTQYDSLMEQVEYEFTDESIPQEFQEQFKQLYDISKKMSDEITRESSHEYIVELAKSVKNENHKRQWQLIENLRKLKIKPSKTIISYLVDVTVHPVTKTAIFKWLQDHGISRSVNIHKLDLQIEIKPTDVAEIKNHATFKQVLLLICDLEQQNPTLYMLLKQTLFRYAYVCYPILPPKKAIKQIAEALKNIGEQHLHTKTNEVLSDDIVEYIEEINLYETLYLSIIEE